MKKLISFLLIIVIILSVSACGKPKDEDLTPAGMVIADFTEKAESGKYETAEDLANAVVEADFMPFAGASIPVEPGYLNGFTDEITGFSEGQMFGPVIGSIPFIGYVFVLDEDTDVNAFIDDLESKADLRWNICTSADEMLAGNVGSTVCFVMSPASFED